MGQETIFTNSYRRPGFKDYYFGNNKPFKLKSKEEKNPKEKLFKNFVESKRDSECCTIIQYEAFNNQNNQNQEKKEKNDNNSILKKILNQMKEEKENNSESFSDIILINNWIESQKLPSNIDREALTETAKTIKNFYSNLVSAFSSKNDGKEKIKKIIEMNKKDVEEITEKYIKRIPPKIYKYIPKEGSGKLSKVIFYLLWLILTLFIPKFVFTITKSDNKRYESISSFDSEILNKIKSKDDINILGKEAIEDLKLKMYKFADLGYKIRSKEKENIFPEPFMNWEIINYKLIGNDNSFYVLKDEKNKKLIVTFPGTKFKSLQLLEEILGSSLTNFHKNNTDVILISRYFGERISELLNHIFTPEINKLLQDNYQIISTGHSLGGAIAQAFIYFSLVEKKINKNNAPMSITFNQPKVGNKLFSEYLDKNAFNLRFTQAGDIVSEIPFSNFAFLDVCKYIIHKRNIYNEYVHTSHEMNYTKGFCFPILIQLIFIIILFLLSLTPFLYFTNSFLGKLLIPDSDFSKRLAIASILIIILTIFLICFILYKILIYVIKYRAWIFFLFILFTFIPFLFFLLIFGFILVVIYIYDMVILFYNNTIKIVNKFIDEQEQVQIDEEKFEKASLEEKYAVIWGFISLYSSSFLLA